MVKKKIDPSAPDAGDFGRPEKKKMVCTLCGPNRCRYSRGRGLNRQTCLVEKQEIAA